MKILDTVRQQAKMVAENAHFVQIHYDKIDAYANSLPLEDIDAPPLDPECHYIQHDEYTLLYFLTLEGINFGSGYFPHLTHKVAGSGYFTVAKAWKKYFEKPDKVTARTLAKLTTEDCMAIFGQSNHNPPIVELMSLFATALNQIGTLLIEKYDGQVGNLFQAADHSAEQLVLLLIQLPCFQDFATYGTEKIPILKRAQITAADISLAFNNQGLGHFKDLDQLTIFADNMVPHVLRCDGIISYAPALTIKIDAHTLIPASSKEEVEIRTCAIHAVELMRAVLVAKGHPINSIDLDYLLWNRGQAPFYETTFPIHLTRTIFY
ncbi:MAG: queuosine salvage family protein [Bacteroidota bacterium]